MLWTGMNERYALPDDLCILWTTKHFKQIHHHYENQYDGSTKEDMGYTDQGLFLLAVCDQK